MVFFLIKLFEFIPFSHSRFYQLPFEVTFFWYLDFLCNFQGCTLEFFSVECREWLIVRRNDFHFRLQSEKRDGVWKICSQRFSRHYGNSLRLMHFYVCIDRRAPISNSFLDTHAVWFYAKMNIIFWVGNEKPRKGYREEGRTNFTPFYFHATCDFGFKEGYFQNEKGRF